MVFEDVDPTLIQGCWIVDQIYDQKLPNFSFKLGKN